MTDISLAAAAGAGLLSFLSPCVLPLAPPYLCYLAGTSIEQLTDESEPRARRDIFVASLLFVAGFATVFVSLGATASVFGALLRQWSHALSILAGFGIMAMGAHFLGLFRIGAMLREKRVEIEKPPGLWAAYLMGLAFAFGWTPCIGPILAAILAVAGTQETVGARRAAAGGLCLRARRAVRARRAGDGAVPRLLARLPHPIRAARKGRRRAAGADGRRVPDRRLPGRLGLADRDVPLDRTFGVGGVQTASVPSRHEGREFQTAARASSSSPSPH